VNWRYFREFLIVIENLTREEVNKLFLATDYNGRMVFHMAADLCELEVFQRIFNRAKNNLTREEVNKLLLDTKNEGRTVFHMAAEFFAIELFHGICNCAKENLTKE
jgi:predicted RNA-binding protein (virulence factor B family)